MNKQQLQQKITNMECELVEMKALLSQSKSTYWQPKKEEEQYFYVNLHLEVQHGYFNPNTKEDHVRYRVFQTKTEAQKYADYIKAEETLRKAIAEANEGWWPDWTDDDQMKHILYFNTRKNRLELDWFKNLKRNNNFLYIKSEPLAKQLAEDYEQAFKTYLTY